MNSSKGAVCLMLCAQVLMFGFTAGDHLTVYRNTINATFGQSVLLPVAVTLTYQFSKYTVEWEVDKQSILYHTVLNCTLDSQGSPSLIIDESFVMYTPFSDNMKFYKKNSSLLIYNAQVNDSGTYRISFSTTRHTSSHNITLRVLMEQPPDSAAARTWKPWIFAFWKVVLLFPLTALLIIIHVCR